MGLRCVVCVCGRCGNVWEGDVCVLMVVCWCFDVVMMMCGD